MIPLGWEEVEALGLGRVDGRPADGVVRRVHDDSRDARLGDLFVALNTGTRFVDDARARGAATLVPDDQEAALGALAALVRGRSDAQVVAVVGSTGKTTTKDALGALAGAVTPTIAAEASRNNELGLPLTVLRLEPDTRVLVTEMGMRGLGQIAELCAVARPTAVLVTSIGPEHLELVGTVDDVARANAEALDSLPAGGIAVVPAGEPLLEPFLRPDLDVRRFDRSGVMRAGSAWSFAVAGHTLELELPFDQRHLAENVLAALTTYDALGLPLERAHEGARSIALSRWRGEVADLPGGGFVVNDAYNANPTSMRAALVDLAERAGDRRRVAILGEMAELGDASARYHEEMRSLLGELGIEVVVGVGEGARAYLDGADEQLLVPDAAAFADIAGLLRPGDAILVKASRAVGLEGIPALIEKHSPGMVRVLVAGLVAMVIAVAVGPTFIEWLRRKSIGQHIREEGPASHMVKQGTPTMGGLLILIAALTPALAVSLYTIPGVTILLATLACALLGFTDDYLKVRRQRSLGLPGRWKMLGLLIVTAGVGWATTRIGYMDTEIYFPVVDVNVDLHWLYFPFLFLVIAGTSNGVNLTDGIDGLAAGTCAISIITLLAIALIDWLRSADTVAARSDEYLDIAIVSAALIGGVIGFLWFNAFPAEMFMGDTGSMALGGAIATLAILTETEVLLVFIGGVFVIEAVTWIIQIATFKRTGRRVFLIVPIHHHFEMKAWSETKIMVRFWIVGAILCALGFVLYYRYYLRFQL